MMIKYLGVAAALAATYGIEGAIEVTTFFLALLASMFYFVAFRLFTGLSQAALSTDFDVLHMLMVYMIYITMATLVYMSPYSYIAFVALPWLIIQGSANILSLLVKFDIIGIKDNE
jgi:hypothetical protein